MTIHPLERRVQAGDVPLDKLAANTQLPERDKIAQASRQFEAILVRQILATAHDPGIRSSTNHSSAANDIYKEMWTEQVADSICSSRGLGFAAALSQQLGSQFDVNPSNESLADPETPRK